MKGFVYRLVPPRPDFPAGISEDESATMGAHALYLRGHAEQGRVLAYGPVADPAGSYGIGILLVEDEDAARAIADNDPAVLSPHGFRVEVAPMMVLITPTDRYEA